MVNAINIRDGDRKSFVSIGEMNNEVNENIGILDFIKACQPVDVIDTTDMTKKAKEFIEESETESVRNVGTTQKNKKK